MKWIKELSRNFRIKLVILMYFKLWINEAHYFLVFMIHCVKSVRIRRFSGSYFPTLGLNTDTFHAVIGFENVHIYSNERFWRPISPQLRECFVHIK